MAGRVNRGEVWLHEFKPPDKRRPVLILSRQRAIDLLNTVMVAPITSTIRGLPSEVVVGPAEGLKVASAVNLDHMHTVRKEELGNFVGSLGLEKMLAVCRALALATGCAD